MSDRLHASPSGLGDEQPPPPESFANVDDIYPEFLYHVEALQSCGHRLSNKLLRSQAHTCLISNDAPEDQLDRGVNRLLELYNADKAEQEEVLAFNRGELAKEVENESQKLMLHQDSQFLSRSAKDWLRRTYVLSKFGVVSHAFFKNTLPSELPHWPSSSLQIPEDTTEYVSLDDIKPPPIAFDTVPSDILGINWLQAARTVHDFVPLAISLPEQQFVDQLWAPLLVSCFHIADKDGVFSSTSQLSMRKIVQKLKADRYIDLAYLLKRFTSRKDLSAAFKIPILMVEVSAFEVKYEYDHKDFLKLLVAMAVALVALLGIFRNWPADEKKQLRMFGMFISGHQCLPFVMAPVDIDSNTASFAVYCDQKNRFNLFDNDSPSIPDTTFIEPGASELEQLQEENDQVQQLLENAGVRLDTLDVSANIIASRLKRLVAFCSTVSCYGRKFRGFLENLHHPEKPFSMWSEASIIPQSRPSHEQSTPATKRFRMSSKRPQRSRGRNVSIQEACHDDGSKIAIKDKRHSSRKEADMLSAAQGDGIVVLKGFRLPDDSSSRGCILLEELLDYVDFAGLSIAELGLLGIRLFIDGLSALETLQTRGIVHRDISPKNLMYSFETQSWRLTDFDAAEFQSCATSTLHRFGTDGFIAPESISSGEYTYASDRWSLGRTLEYIISCIRDQVWSRTEDAQGVNIEDLLIRLEADYCLFLLHDDPALRQITSSGLEYLSVQHTLFENYVARRVHPRHQTIRPRTLFTNTRPLTQNADRDRETVSNLDLTAPAVS